MLITIIVDIFSIYGVAKSSLTTAKFVDIILALFYIIVNLMLKIMICHIGHSTIHEAENVKISFTKGMNKINIASEKASLLYAYKQMESRDLRLQNVFFVVDWQVLFKVS